MNPTDTDLMFLSLCCLDVKYKDIKINLMDYLPSIKAGNIFTSQQLKIFYDVYCKLNNLNNIKHSPLYHECLNTDNFMYVTNNDLSKSAKNIILLSEIDQLMSKMTFPKIIELTKIKPIGTSVHNVKIDYSNLFNMLMISIKHRLNHFLSILIKNKDILLMNYIYHGSYNKVKISLKDNSCSFVGLSIISKFTFRDIIMLLKDACINKLFHFNQAIINMTLDLDNSDISKIMKYYLDILLMYLITPEDIITYQIDY